MLKSTELYTFKWWILWYVQYISKNSCNLRTCPGYELCLMQPLVYSRFSASICSANILDSRHRSQECRVTREPLLQTVLIAEGGGHPIISYVVARSWRFTMCHLMIQEEENWQTRNGRELSQAGSQVWSLRFPHCPVSWTWHHKPPTHTRTPTIWTAEKPSFII